jgi:hypothetical protein
VTLEVWNGISGTLGGGNSATSLHTTGAAANAWTGSTVRLTSGPQSGQARSIKSQAAAVSTLESGTSVAPYGPLPGSPNVGDAWTITPDQKGSTRFTATVGGQPSFVWGRSKICDGQTTAWAGNTRVDHSEIKYGSDAIQTVVITLVSGPVTGYTIFPAVIGVVASIVGGNLQVTMPPDTWVEVTINGDAVHRFVIDAQTLANPIVGTQVIYDGSQTSVSAGQVLVFNPGVWLLAVQPFPIATGGSVYLKRGAWVTGNFDERSSSNTVVDGPGYLSGDLITSTTGAVVGAGSSTVTNSVGLGTKFSNGYWADGTITMTSGVNVGLTRKISTQTATVINHEAFPAASSNADTFTLRGGATAVSSMPFATGVLYCAILGADSTFVPSYFQTSNNVVRQITIIDPGLFDVFFGPSVIDRVRGVVPWIGGTGSITPGYDYSQGETSSITRIRMIEDDDNLNLLENGANVTVDDFVAVHQENAVFRLGYWTDAFSPGFRTTISNVIIRTIAMNDGISHFGSIIGSWTDGGPTDSGKGRSSVSFTNIRVEGPMACKFVDLQNLLYPYGTQASANGQIKDFVIDGFTLTNTPSVLSTILGKDATNTPHDVMFRNGTIGGVSLTRSNFSTYVTTNAYVYNIWVNTVFQVETGAGLTNANAYCSVAYADAYFNDFGAPTSWFNLSQGAKEQAIREATRFVDATFTYVGRKLSKAQSLLWPRTGVVDTEGYGWQSVELHPSLLEATALFALEVANGNSLVKNVLDGNPGIRSESGTLPGPLSSSKTYAGVKGTQPFYTLAIRVLSYILDTSARDTLLRV